MESRSLELLQPLPYSPEAVAHGCTCPSKSEADFGWIIDRTCPLPGDDARARCQAEWREQCRNEFPDVLTTPRNTRTIFNQFRSYSLKLNSKDRLPDLLGVMENMPGPMFWKAMIHTWSVCEDTWQYQDRLLVLLRQHAETAPARIRNALLYDELDDLIVFRGCSRQRVRGISWTTDRRVAKKFAVGHRGFG